MALVRWIRNLDPWDGEAGAWNPWGEVRRLQDEMNRLFEGTGLERLTRPWRHSPAINVAVTNDAVIVTAELPGVKPEDVSLSIMGQTLTLKGARKPVHGDKQVTYHRQERSLGEFARSIELPDKVEGDKATAEFDQGILTVRIPKAPEAVPRQIAVKVK